MGSPLHARHAALLRALCGFAVLTKVVAETCGAACNAGSDGTADDVALLQHRPQAAVAAEPPPGDTRMLATIPHHPNFRLPLDRNANVIVRSVVPVFPPDGGPSYVAFVFDYFKNTYAILENETEYLSCAPTERPDKMVPMKMLGGERHITGRWSLILKCPWSEERRHERCHNISVFARGQDKAMAEYQTCHDPALAAEGPFEMAACVQPTFEVDGRPYASGIMMLPQWLEYSVSKGVQHFLIYTTPEMADLQGYSVLKPFFDAKMLTQIRLEVPFVRAHGGKKTQLIAINDCLHRMKGRARWLMPTVDIDEYNVFNSSDHMRGLSYVDAIQESIETPYAKRKLANEHIDEVHAVNYGRMNFEHPMRPYEQLQINSVIREPSLPRLCSKYFVRVDLVDALFVHWPMSWKNGTGHLRLPRAQLVSYHYRMVPGSLNNTVADPILDSQAPVLGEALKQRYGKPWPEFARSLLLAKPASLAAATASVGGEDQSVFEDQSLLDEAAYTEAATAAFTDLLNEMTEPTLIQDLIPHSLD